jgi:hypothetical protein
VHQDRGEAARAGAKQTIALSVKSSDFSNFRKLAFVFKKLWFSAIPEPMTVLNKTQNSP